MKHFIFIIKAVALPLYNVFECTCVVHPTYINYKELYVMHYKHVALSEAKELLKKRDSYRGFYPAH
jgi:hypothetical protein